MNIYKSSAEILYATFDLTKANLKLNEYFFLQVNNETSIQSIDIIDGVLGSAQIKMNVANARYVINQFGYVDVTIQNFGDTDANIPIILISTTDNSANFDSFYTIKSVNSQPYLPYTYDYLITYNSNGVGSIIQPRSFVSLKIKVKPKSNFLGSAPFNLFQYNESFLYEYIKNNIDAYKPNGFTSTMWKVLSQRLISKIKENTKEIFHETVNHLSLHNIEFYRVDDLICYHINRLDGAYFRKNLIDYEEFYIIQNDFIYTRSYPMRNSLRSLKSTPFGLGWMDNLNIKLVKNDDFNYLTLTMSGVDHFILYSSNSTFYSPTHQIKYNEIQNRATILFTQTNVIYEYDLKSNCVYKIQTSRGKIIWAACKNGMISEITYSEVRIQFLYNPKNLLSTIKKRLLGSQAETYSYIYDTSDRLTSITTPKSTISYKYDESNNLVQSSQDINDGNQILMNYEYNQDGLLSQQSNYENNVKIFCYQYVYYDYGPIDVINIMNGETIRYLFDLNGRLVSYTINKARKIDFISTN